MQHFMIDQEKTTKTDQKTDEIHLRYKNNPKALLFIQDFFGIVS